MTLRDSQTASKYSQVLDEAKAFIYTIITPRRRFPEHGGCQRSISSPSYFSSIFNQEMGVTFVEFLTRSAHGKGKGAADVLLILRPLKSGTGWDIRIPITSAICLRKPLDVHLKEYRAGSRGGVMTGKMEDRVRQKGRTEQMRRNRALGRIGTRTISWIACPWKRLNLMTFIIIIPLAVLVILSYGHGGQVLQCLHPEYRQYHPGQQCTANLREDVDYSMYRIVIRNADLPVHP